MRASTTITHINALHIHLSSEAKARARARARAKLQDSRKAKSTAEAKKRVRTAQRKFRQRTRYQRHRRAMKDREVLIFQQFLSWAVTVWWILILLGWGFDLAYYAGICQRMA